MRHLDAIIIHSPVGTRDTLLLLQEIEYLHRQKRTEREEVNRVVQLQLSLHPEVADE